MPPRKFKGIPPKPRTLTMFSYCHARPTPQRSITNLRLSANFAERKFRRPRRLVRQFLVRLLDIASIIITERKNKNQYVGNPSSFRFSLSLKINWYILGELISSSSSFSSSSSSSSSSTTTSSSSSSTTTSSSSSSSSSSSYNSSFFICFSLSAFSLLAFHHIPFCSFLSFFIQNDIINHPLLIFVVQFTPRARENYFYDFYFFSHNATTTNSE